MNEILANNTTSSNSVENPISDTKNPQVKKEPKEKKKFRFWPQKKWQQTLLIIAMVFLVFLSAIGVVGAYTYKTATQLTTQGRELENQLRSAYEQFSGQNLPAAEAALIDAQNQLQTIQETYQQLSLYNNLPWLKNYYQDGQAGLDAADHGLQAAVVAFKAITPYADILGFEGEESFEGGTAEDRIGLMLQTLEMVVPELDEIEDNLLAVQANLNRIDPSRYPEELRGGQVRSQIIEAKQLLDQTFAIFLDFRPVIEELPSIAGSNEPKKYLILFQNDNELRPTGGFLTAYSIINIEDGKVTPEKSDDIYALDQKFTERITIPESLGRYLTTERFWNLRDMNISPDFKASMDTFFSYYSQVRGEPKDIDGIIAVDTQVLTQLLTILGPVEVPGYGTFSAEIDPRCECPQVVYALSEIITRPTPYLRDDRKGILGPMMQAILHKTYEAPKQYWSDLFALTWDSIKGRHLQLYFIDETAQLAAENAQAAGRLNAPESGDFIAIIDANLGGAKSNLFTEYSVLQTIEGPINGLLNKTVEITYRNTRKADNCDLEAGELCLNAIAPTWHRLYLPLGSQLVEAQGFTQEPNLYEELDLQVIDGFYKLDPLGVARIRITYQVPYDLDDYHLTIWKQGGVKPFETIIDVNDNQTQLLIDQDTTFRDQF